MPGMPGQMPGMPGQMGGMPGQMPGMPGMGMPGMNPMIRVISGTAPNQKNRASA